MFDIWIDNNVALTVDEFEVAKRIADSIREANRKSAVTVRRHRQDIGDIYVA